MGATFARLGGEGVPRGTNFYRRNLNSLPVVWPFQGAIPQTVPAMWLRFLATCEQTCNPAKRGLPPAAPAPGGRGATKGANEMDTSPAADLGAGLLSDVTAEGAESSPRDDSGKPRPSAAAPVHASRAAGTPSAPLRGCLGHPAARHPVRPLCRTPSTPPPLNDPVGARR